MNKEKEKSNDIELDSLSFERTKEEDDEIKKLEKIYEDKLKEENNIEEKEEKESKKDLNILSPIVPSSPITQITESSISPENDIIKSPKSQSTIKKLTSKYK